MNFSELMQNINGDYLENAIPLTAIQTKADKARLGLEGLPYAMTVMEWESLFPHIDKNKVFFTYKRCGDIFYYDRQTHVFIPLMGLIVSILPSPDGKTADIPAAEKKTLANIHKVELLLSKGEFVSALLGTDGATMMHIARDIIREKSPSSKLYDFFISIYSYVDAGASLVDVKLVSNLAKAKSQEQIERTMESMSEFPEKITVWRGEGSASTPTNKAFSWTTSPRIAATFAFWYAGTSYRLIKGTVRKDKVVERIADRGEEELIILPSDVEDIKIMHCLTMDELIDNKPGPLARAQEYVESYRDHELLNNDIPDHEKGHMLRVAILSSYLGEHEKVKETSDDLMMAALFHDCGRVHGGIDSEHGAASYQRYKAVFGENKRVEFLMNYHCREDEKAKSALGRFPENDKKDLWKAYCVLKDADAIDRVRLDRESFVDPSMLRFPYSVKLIGAAVDLLKKYKV